MKLLQITITLHFAQDVKTRHRERQQSWLEQTCAPHFKSSQLIIAQVTPALTLLLTQHYMMIIITNQCNKL